jgi:hypothetical protein
MIHWPPPCIISTACSNWSATNPKHSRAAFSEPAEFAPRVAAAQPAEEEEDEDEEVAPPPVPKKTVVTKKKVVAGMK